MGARIVGVSFAVEGGRHCRPDTRARVPLSATECDRPHATIDTCLSERVVSCRIPTFARAKDDEDDDEEPCSGPSYSSFHRPHSYTADVRPCDDDDESMRARNQAKTPLFTSSIDSFASLPRSLRISKTPLLPPSRVSHEGPLAAEELSAE